MRRRRLLREHSLNVAGVERVWLRYKGSLVNRPLLDHQLTAGSSLSCLWLILGPRGQQQMQASRQACQREAQAVAWK